MLFSQRKGLTPIKKLVQKDSVDDALAMSRPSGCAASFLMGEVMYIQVLSKHI